jgi:UDPglucose 6-dehydrogenase
MKIVIVGSGYVGLVTGACLAELGHDIVCVDIAAGKIAALERGEMPIFEPGLKEMVAANRAAGRLSFTTDLAGALPGARAAFIAVGTPTPPRDRPADLAFVHAAARDIARAATGPLVIVTKSTVPVGTGDEVERIANATRPDMAFKVVSNPEFLREGAAIGDFMKPDRIVVGSDDADATAVLQAIYQPLTDVGAPLVVTSRRTSELIKYAANAFLATKIAFINEMADLCEAVGADVTQVSKGIGLDTRIGAKFLNAGPGFGGSCFPKDTMALLKTAHDAGLPLRIVETLVTVNDQRRRAMARKVIQAAGGDVRGKTVAVLGLTFKPDTDDMREAPSIAIITALQDAGARVRAYDPEGMPHAPQFIDGVDYAPDPMACLRGADAAVLVTEWAVFRTLDLNAVADAMAKPVLVDLRNVFDPATARAAGLTYVGIGRG